MVGLIVSIILFLVGLRALAAIVPAAYLAAVFATTLIELVRRRDLAALGLPVVLPTMHLSWALGFMTGDIADPGPQIPRLETQ